MSRKSVLAWALLGSTLLAAPALAQQPPAPNPADVVPDKMPFDIPYGMSIGLEQAKQLMAAAEAEAKKRNWKMNIAIVDTNGELVLFERMEGAQIASVSISTNKARTAARFRRETRLFFNAFETGHGYIATLDPTLTASPGGFPLVENGKIIGGIGCSGGTGDHERGSGIVDQNAIRFVDQHKEQATLHGLLFPPTIGFTREATDEIRSGVLLATQENPIAQKIEAEFLAGSVRDIASIGFSTIVRLCAAFDDSDREPQRRVDRLHQLGVATSEVVVHRRQVGAATVKGIDVEGQRRG